MTMAISEPFPAERWNACLDLLGRPLEDLDAVQRPAALAFHYYGRVMNGGHSLHFDYGEDELDGELLDALKTIGACEHAKIFAEVLRRRREIHPTTAEEEDAEAEFVERHLDAKFDMVRPDMCEILEAYFEAHPESFPE